MWRPTLPRALGHTTGTKVERIYDQYEYLQERREALELWGLHVRKLVRAAYSAETPGEAHAASSCCWRCKSSTCRSESG